MMGTLRFMAALLGGKATRILCRALGWGGSALPGTVALRIDPMLLDKAIRRLPMGGVAVSGTNGKTTTSAMLAAILEANGRRVANNAAGANMIGGIAAALVSAFDPLCRARADVAVLEVDEATFPLLLRKSSCRAAVVTNLFHDQPDRYGDPLATARLLSRAFKDAADRGALGLLILNADDPLVAHLGLAEGVRAAYFGLEDASLIRRCGGPVPCPACGKLLSYQGRYYASLGLYACDSCGFGRPSPSYQARLVAPGTTSSPSRATFWLRGVSNDATLFAPGLYNVYNALAAAAAADFLGVPSSEAASSISRFRGSFGRMERLPIEGRSVVLALVKNSAGLDEVFKVMSREAARHALFCLNDNSGDGRDVSWIWDADFESFVGRTGEGFLGATGLRAADMAVRLKYAGADPRRIAVKRDLLGAFREAVKAVPRGGTLWVLSTYSCMLDLRRHLSRRGHRFKW